LTLGCLLVCADFASAGPIIGRSFPDANCAFSLPEADWQWLDQGEAPPGSFKSLAFARNRAGVNFWLKTDTIAPGEGVGPESYDNLERALAKGHQNWTKVGSKHVTFKGVPAFQIDFRQKENKSAGRFLFFFADNRAYMLAVETPAAELGPEADAVLDRFTFLNPPRAMMQPHGDTPGNIADKFDGLKTWMNDSGVVGIGGGVLALLVLFGAWLVFRMRA
jgi:hypothetical protein